MENNTIKLNLVEPRVTEKSLMEQTKRTYVFEVAKSATKQEIAKMVEKEFSVAVEGVRTLIRDGKDKTRFMKRARMNYNTGDRKFAYVTLKEGNSIKLIDEEAVKEEK